MVLISSCRISRVLHYSGILFRFNVHFGYGTFTLFRAAFQPSSPIYIKSYFLGPKPQKYYYSWFGLLQFRSPLLSQSLFIFFSFRYLDVSVPWVPFITLCIRAIIVWYNPYCVPTFGYLRIITYLQFPVAFRSLSRPSSALSAKASTICLL